MKLVALVALLALAQVATANIRWIYPGPRSSDTGLVTGPCGGVVADLTPARIAPGPITVKWAETMNHPGSPFRIAISCSGDQFNSWVLVDRIPHCDAGTVTSDSPRVYNYRINIPNVNGTCTLQLLQVNFDGVPAGTQCTYPGTTNPCSTIYFTCADIVVTGTQDGATISHGSAGNGPYSTSVGSWVAPVTGTDNVAYDYTLPGNINPPVAAAPTPDEQGSTPPPPPTTNNPAENNGGQATDDPEGQAKVDDKGAAYAVRPVAAVAVVVAALAAAF